MRPRRGPEDKERETRLALALAANEAQLRTLKDNLPIGIYRANEEGHIETANPALLKMLGFDDFEEFQAAPLSDVWVDLSKRTELIVRMRAEGAVTDFEARLRRKDGTLIWGLFHAFGVFDDQGHLLYFDTTVQDITEKKDAFERLAKMARTDGLTGLFNRQYLLERLEEEVRRARRYEHPLAVLLVDLDHFKSVNDTYGHLVGDRVLTATAGIICGSLRAADLVGRYGGEEFCVVLPETARKEAVAVAERVRVRVSELLHESETGDLLRLTCSIGVAAVAGEPVSASGLLKTADEALYEAKRMGRNRVVVAGSSL